MSSSVARNVAKSGSEKRKRNVVVSKRKPASCAKRRKKSSVNGAPKSDASKTRNSELLWRSNAPRKRKSSASSPKKRNASRNVPRAVKKRNAVVGVEAELGEDAAVKPQLPQNPPLNPNPTGETYANRHPNHLLPPPQLPRPRRTECGSLRGASARVVEQVEPPIGHHAAEMSASLLLEEQELIASGVGVAQLGMTTRTIVRAVEIVEGTIVGRCDVEIARNVATVVMIVDRCGGVTGHRCATANGADRVECVVTTAVVVANVAKEVA